MIHPVDNLDKPVLDATSTPGTEPAPPFVLIVDDEPLALDMASLALQRQGFRTEIARGGEEGWHLLQVMKFDMVLLDITMPDIDGFEVFRRIRANPKLETLPVIFVTARDDLEHRVKGLELGAVDYITKPFNVNELAARVRSTLRMRTLEKQLLEREREDIRVQTVRQLLTTIAHYINNSVTAIEGRTAVTPSQKPEEVEKLKSVIQRQCRVISATIHAIRQLLERMEMPTVNYSSMDVLMLDIEEMIKNRLAELDQYDKNMGRA